MATLTEGLRNLQRQLDVAFPDRHKPDGWIGDAAHRDRTSGHNPDDTAGSKAAWNADPDKLAEVRALDVAADLGPGVDSLDVVRHLIRLPRFATVIRYVIHRGKIYHSRDGFAPAAYSGSNPHDHHIHFEGAWSQAGDSNTSYDYRLEEIPVALSGADKQWLTSMVGARCDALRDALRAELLAQMPAAVGNLKVNVTPGEKAANMQPWARVDAYGSPERHEIKGIVTEIDAKVQKLLDAGKTEA